MALSGWNPNNIFKLTIDGSKIEGDLTNFPINVTLSSGTGITGFDASAVFDELTSSSTDSYTKLLLHMDDPGLIDSSGYSHTTTLSGNVSASSTQSKFGGYSAYFVGVGDYLSVPDHDDWNLGSGNFTIDFWIRFGATATIQIIWEQAYADPFQVFYWDGPGGNLVFNSTNTGSVANYDWLWTPTISTWYHIALIRNGTSLNCYVDGVRLVPNVTTPISTNTLPDASAVLTIGARSTGIFPIITGYIDEFRWSKGIARWTSSFIPPEGPYGSSWDNRKKIAITDSDDNLLYTEIERWDYINEEANLWVKVPTIVSGTDTNLYFYYDATASGNFAYVGESSDVISYYSAVAPGDEGTYDTVHARPLSSIMKDGNIYKMWYSGNNGTNWRIIYATSADGINWSNFQMVVDIGSEGTYDTANTIAPSIIKDGDIYKMWYSGHNGTNWRIIYATSADGINWSNFQMVVNIGDEGTYDTNGAYAPSIIKDGDIYKMWYGGSDGTNWRIIYATSADGINWSNFQMVVNIGDEGTYDTVNAGYPFVMKDDDIYKMWYAGNNGTNWRIIYTESYFADFTTPSQNVWDDNFVGVWHMAQDPNGDGADAIKDSTNSLIHLTPAGSMTTVDLVDGLIGKAISFDGIDDRLQLSGGDVDLEQQTITVEAVAYPTNVGSEALVAYRPQYAWADGRGYYVYNHTCTKGSADGTWESSGWNISPTVSGWNYMVFRYENSGDLYTWLNSNPDDQDTPDTGGINYTNGVGSEGKWFYVGRVTDNSGVGTNYFVGSIDEVRISKIKRTDAWVKTTYYSNLNSLITFYTVTEINFSNPSPTNLSTVYGTTQQLYLTTTVSGGEPNCIYDATFYDAYNDSVIDSTISGIQSGQPAGVTMLTPSGIDYQWYVTATSSGSQDTSDIYTFTNKFLCSGQVQVSDVPASGIPVRLYLRDTGEYIGGTTSAGVSGTFEIETTHNDYHYVVALYGTSNTNALIEDWLIPD